MNDRYASLDAAIVKAIRDGANTFMILVNRLESTVDHWRVIDRRLQSLRKREQDWFSSDLCVVRTPKRSLALGAYCPSREMLDEIIDAALTAKGEAK